LVLAVLVAQLQPTVRGRLGLTASLLALLPMAVGAAALRMVALAVLAVEERTQTEMGVQATLRPVAVLHLSTVSVLLFRTVKVSTAGRMLHMVPEQAVAGLPLAEMGGQIM
jgi:hypothetical protein